MLAKKHQYMQAYYGAGSFFPATLHVADAQHLCHSRPTFSPEVQSCLATVNAQQSDADIMICSSITFKGITYKKDLFVIVQETDDCVYIGQILLILNAGDDVFLIVRLYESAYI